MSDQPNYSWRSTVVVPADAPFKPGSTEGKIEKGGFTWVSLSMMDNKIEVVTKENKGVIKQDGAWKSFEDFDEEEGFERMPAIVVRGIKTPAIRFLRIRAGNNTGQFRSESFRAYDSENFIVDHCSCSWGNPETLSTSGSLDRYTVQWCIISEGNNRQRHAFATGLGGDRSTWHHNLFAHMEARVPRWGDITVQCYFRGAISTVCRCSSSIARTFGEAVMPSEPVAL